MIEQINTFDTHLFLFLNSLHTDWLDSVMLFISYNKIFMLFIIAGLSALSIKVYRKKFIGLFILCLICFGLSDTISTKVFKDNTKRLRPCHEEGLKDQVHLAGQNCWGGKYGFVSSHASNSFAIITFFFLILKGYYSFIKWMYLYAGLVAYSRIYLAKHYPLDVICGAMLGVLISYLIINLVKKLAAEILRPTQYS